MWFRLICISFQWDVAKTHNCFLLKLTLYWICCLKPQFWTTEYKVSWPKIFGAVLFSVLIRFLIAFVFFFDRIALFPPTFQKHFIRFVYYFHVWVVCCQSINVSSCSLLFNFSQFNSRYLNLPKCHIEMNKMLSCYHVLMLMNDLF